MLKINHLQIDSPLLLAPLAGYTDLPFRKICRIFGAGMVFTELISAEGIVRKNTKTLNLMKISSKEQPVSIQIFGNDPYTMSEAAKIVEQYGPATIDINIGCCARKVCNTGSGAALLNDAGLLYKIVTSVINSINIPVTAKIRIGWDEKNKNFLQIIEVLNDCGITFISVHGRTRAQQYSGKADWDIINEISNISKVPIVGNGDINSYNDAIAKLKETNCLAVMVGRAALGNPWIFCNKKPSKNEIIQMIKKHLEMMLDYYGNKGILLMRKHIVKYIHDFKNAGHVRGKLVLAKSKSEIFKLLEEIPA